MGETQLDVQKAISNIRATLSRLVGVKLKFKTNLGRCRVHETEGIIKEVYPNLFVIIICDEYSEKCVTYTYSDVLTGIVEIYDCEDGRKIFELN